jgi:hypothetical protein
VADQADPTVIDWGNGWTPLHEPDDLEAELFAELAPEHPLSSCTPMLFGRCLACDDVVAALVHQAGEPELAVIHLTWRRSAERPPFPYHERMTTAEFIQRFLRAGEHL